MHQTYLSVGGITIRKGIYMLQRVFVVGSGGIDTQVAGSSNFAVKKTEMLMIWSSSSFRGTPRVVHQTCLSVGGITIRKGIYMLQRVFVVGSD